MKRGGFTSPDDRVRLALETLDQFVNDDLDEATIAAIGRAESEDVRGEGIPLDEGLAELRRKHFGM